MPGCWDGVNLDSSDHKSHMAYPDGVDNGQCPPTHPRHLVTLFYEVWYSVGPFNALNDGGRFVLSTGDTTGYSLHADFMNGWNREVLERAVQTCTNNSGVIEDCPVFANENRFVPDDVMNSCAAHNPVPSENFVGPNPHLPGCVAVTEGPASATAADIVPGCVPGAPNPVHVSSQSSSSSAVSTSSPPANLPPSTKPAPAHSSSTTPASPSGNPSNPTISESPAPASPPSGNNVAHESPSSSPAQGATKLGSTAQPSSVPASHPAHSPSLSSPKPEPTGNDHHDPHHDHRPQQHGHHSEQHDHHSEQHDHHFQQQDQQDDSADVEYCHERPPPPTSKKPKNTRAPMRRRHHARRAGHGSYMHL